MAVEWHLPPDYIVKNWTDELLALMCEKLADRKKRELDTIEKYRSKSNRVGNAQEVSKEELFARAKNVIKVVHNADNRW